MGTGTTQQRGGCRREKSADQKGGSNVERRPTTTRGADWKTKLITTIAVIGAFLGAAVPAVADNLISNLGGTQIGGFRLSENDVAMSFTTGPNASGYQFESLSIGYTRTSDDIHDPVYVSLNTGSANGPDTSGRGQIAFLANRGGHRVHANQRRYTRPGVRVPQHW